MAVKKLLNHKTNLLMLIGKKDNNFQWFNCQYISRLILFTFTNNPL